MPHGDPLFSSTGGAQCAVASHTQACVAQGHGDPLMAAAVKTSSSAPNLRRDPSLPRLRRKQSVVVLDGLGSETPVERTVDSVKNRFFALGLQTGVAMQMFGTSIVMMVCSYDDRTGAVAELAHTYYPLFRGLFLLCFFGSAYGMCLYVFKRTGVRYDLVLDVERGIHNYHAILRASFTLMSVVFLTFAAFVLSLLLKRGDKV